MTRKILATAIACNVAWLAALATTTVNAQGIPVFGAGDTAIAIDATGKTARSNHPAGENPPKAIDAMLGTKYLNFGAAGSGFIVTPTPVPPAVTPAPVESLQIRTANDAPARDPANWELYGFNGALTSVNNSSGLDEAWTLIDSGFVALPGDPLTNLDQRGVLGPLVNVNGGGVGYEHYKVIFPTLKDLSRANSMQIDEIQLFADDAGTTGILAPSNPILAVHFGEESRYPNNERPAQALDGLANTKYLNFGRENSGLIVTNSDGPVQIANMSLTTANDAADRDPASFELWGTNDAIQSLDNTSGTGGEVWTLISSGPLALPGDITLDDGRGQTAVVPINASAAYQSYKIVFPTVKNVAGANSMQIANIQLFAVPEPATAALAIASLIVGFGLRRKA